MKQLMRNLFSIDWKATKQTCKTNPVAIFVPSAALLLISLAVAIAVSISVQRAERETARTSLQDLTQQLGTSLETEIKGYADDVEDLAAFYATQRNTSLYAWSVIINSIQQRRTGVVGCAVMVNVSNDNRAEHEREMSKHLGRTYFIYDGDKPGIPSGARPYYVPYIRSGSINSTVLGYDNWNSLDRRSSIMSAINAGTTTLSSVFKLNSGEPSLSYLKPIYSCDTWRQRPDLCTVPPPSLRSSMFTNIVSCIFRPEHLFSNITTKIFPNRSWKWCVFLNNNYLEGDCDMKSSKIIDRDLAYYFTLASEDWTVAIEETNQYYSEHTSATVVALGVVIAVSGFIGSLCIAWAVITSKIHTLKMIEEEKKLQQERLKAYHAATRQFLQCTSHDMRAPLQASLNAVTLLKDELGNKAPEFQTSLMNVILGCATFLEGLMDNVLDVSKIETNRLELVEAPVFLHREIAQMIEIIEAASFTPDTVAIETELEELPMVVCDVGKLKRAVLNLVSNAAKFTLQGKISVAMKSYSLAHSGENGDLVGVKIVVKDTGCGMTPDQMKALGTPFVHREAAKGGGSGLGVYICKSYVQMYEGEFLVDSKLDQGTSVTILLKLRRFSENTSEDDFPYGTASAAARRRNNSKNKNGRKESVGENAAAVASSSSSIPPSSLITSVGRRATQSVSLHPHKPLIRSILLCEDHPVTRKMMQVMLQRMGFLVDVAADGGEAEAKLRGQCYDFVFMDMQMPVKNGDVVVSEFRHWEKQQMGRDRVLIAALTGNATTEDQDNCSKSGCDFFLVKPCRRDQLATVLGMRGGGSATPSPGTAGTQASHVVGGFRDDESRVSNGSVGGGGGGGNKNNCNHNQSDDNNVENNDLSLNGSSQLDEKKRRKQMIASENPGIIKEEDGSSSSNASVNGGAGVGGGLGGHRHVVSSVAAAAALFSEAEEAQNIDGLVVVALDRTPSRNRSNENGVDVSNNNNNNSNNLSNNNVNVNSNSVNLHQESSNNNHPSNFNIIINNNSNNNNNNNSRAAATLTVVSVSSPPFPSPAYLTTNSSAGVKSSQFFAMGEDWPSPPPAPPLPPSEVTVLKEEGEEEERGGEASHRSLLSPSSSSSHRVYDDLNGVSLVSGGISLSSSSFPFLPVAPAASSTAESDIWNGTHNQSPQQSHRPHSFNLLSSIIHHSSNSNNNSHSSSHSIDDLKEKIMNGEGEDDIVDDIVQISIAPHPFSSSSPSSSSFAAASSSPPPRVFQRAEAFM